MRSDESGADQNHTDDDEQLNNTDAPDNARAVRVRKCLQVMGYCPETGCPAELALRGICILASLSLAATMIQHGTAEHA